MRTPRQAVFTFQPLESRTLFALNLHAAVPGGLPDGAFADSPEITAARDELRKDIVQMRADQRAGREVIDADRKAVIDELAKAREATPDLDDQLQDLRDKLADDRRVGYREIRQDQAAINAKLQEFAPTIREDKKALRQATDSGDQDAIDAAKERLSADRATVEAAIKPLQDELKADQDKTKTVLAADRAAIDDKLGEIDPALQPLLDKLEADGKALDEKLAAERAEIQGDVDALKAAIQAWREANGITTTGGDQQPLGGQQPPPPLGGGQQPPPGGQQQPPPGGQQQPPPPPGDGTQQPPPPGDGTQQPPPPPSGDGTQQPPPPRGDGTQQPPPPPAGDGTKLPPPPPPGGQLPPPPSGDLT